MNETELWKDILCTNGTYEVSNLGNVRNKKNGKILKPRTRSDGYMVVQLCICGVSKTYYVHRLVATEFIENRFNLRCVNHIDENKQNNNVSNLEWCTAMINNNHGTRGKRISKTLSRKVMQYDFDGNVVKIWGSVKEATETLKIRNISQACRGLRKKAGGYKWGYCDERS